MSSPDKQETPKEIAKRLMEDATSRSSSWVTVRVFFDAGVEKENLTPEVEREVRREASAITQGMSASHFGRPKYN
jgi:hypothetical protein